MPPPFCWKESGCLLLEKYELTKYNFSNKDQQSLPLGYAHGHISPALWFWWVSPEEKKWWASLALSLIISTTCKGDMHQKQNKSENNKNKSKLEDLLDIFHPVLKNDHSLYARCKQVASSNPLGWSLVLPVGTHPAPTQDKPNSCLTASGPLLPFLYVPMSYQHYFMIQFNAFKGKIKQK